jgi:UDP-glucose 4-epimerase
MRVQELGPMRVMVTGGAGFIGSTLVDRLLAEGYEVDVVDDLSTGSLANLAEARAAGGRSLRIHQVDIRLPETTDLIVRRRPVIVFHLAAQIDVRVSVADPVFDADVNVLGSLRVLEGARQAGTERIVYAASGGTLYGEPAPKDLPSREAHPARPLSPYGVSKKAVIDYLVAYRELHALEFCALALANVYGPRQDPHGEAGVVAIFAEALVAGRPVTVFGDGRQTRDYVYVDDAVDALARAATKAGGLVCNIGTGRETSVNELYRTMARAAGVDMAPEHAPARPGELLRSALDPSRAELHLGWRPWTELADGTAAVIEMARERQAARAAQSTGGGRRAR